MQIYSVMTHSGEDFTKDVAAALKDLIHVVLVLATVILVLLHSNVAEEYVVGLVLGLAFTMARTISYTMVCSVAEMKFQQFQPALIVFVLGYSGNAANS